MTTNTLDKYSMLTMLTDDLNEVESKHKALKEEYENQAALVLTMKEQLDASNARADSMEYRLAAAKEEQDAEVVKPDDPAMRKLKAKFGFDRKLKGGIG